MCCLSKLEIFIDSYALLTHGRGGFDQLKTENKTKIDPLALELQAISKHYRNGTDARSAIFFSLSLYWLTNLQIFIDLHALLAHSRGGFDQLKTENKTKIDPLAPELQAIFNALPELMRARRSFFL